MKALVGDRDDRILGFTMIGAAAGEVMAAVPTLDTATFSSDIIASVDLHNPMAGVREIRPWPAVQVSSLNSAQARRISIFTCGPWLSFAWLPPSHKSPPLRRACAERQRYQHLGEIRKTTFRRGQISIKD
jgi:hypothetical protein